MGYSLRSLKVPVMKVEEETKKDALHRRSASAQHNASSPFFSRLPPEIRQQIYKYVLCGHPIPPRFHDRLANFAFQSFGHAPLPQQPGKVLTITKYDRSFQIYRKLVCGTAPWQTGYHTQNVSMLLTCSAIFQEARHIALSYLTINVTNNHVMDGMFEHILKRSKVSDAQALRTVKHLCVVLQTKYFYAKHFWQALGQNFAGLETLDVWILEHLFFEHELFRDLWYAIQLIPAKMVTLSPYLGHNMFTDASLTAHHRFAERGAVKLQMVLLGLRTYRSPLPDYEDIEKCLMGMRPTGPKRQNLPSVEGKGEPSHRGQ